jgi:hypothetical protein
MQSRAAPEPRRPQPTNPTRIGWDSWARAVREPNAHAAAPAAAVDVMNWRRVGEQ